MAITSKQLPHPPFLALDSRPLLHTRSTPEGVESGALFPCRIVIWEVETGRQHVYHLDSMILARKVGLAAETETWRAPVDQLSALIDDAFSSMGKESDIRTPGTGTEDRGDQDGDGFRNE